MCLDINNTRFVGHNWVQYGSRVFELKVLVCGIVMAMQYGTNISDELFAFVFSLKMKAIHLSEMSVPIYQTTVSHPSNMTTSDLIFMSVAWNSLLNNRFCHWQWLPDGNCTSWPAIENIADNSYGCIFTNMMSDCISFKVVMTWVIFVYCICLWRALTPTSYSYQLGGRLEPFSWALCQECTRGFYIFHTMHYNLIL
jgi:hypothetical protein